MNMWLYEMGIILIGYNGINATYSVPLIPVL